MHIYILEDHSFNINHISWISWSKNCNNCTGDGHSTNINTTGKLENEYVGLNIRVLIQYLLLNIDVRDSIRSAGERVIGNVIFEYQLNSWKWYIQYCNTCRSHIWIGDIRSQCYQYTEDHYKKYDSIRWAEESVIWNVILEYQLDIAQY
jgi:hypothetical protein